MTTPARDAGPRRLAVNHRQHAVAIEFDERGVLELGAGVSPRTGRHRLEQLAVRQLIQKLVQVPLEGFDGLLEGEEHDDRKGQLALPREIHGAHAMAGDKVTSTQEPAQRFDKLGDMSGDGFVHGWVSPW
jgi:hypothetical protein